MFAGRRRPLVPLAVMFVLLSTLLSTSVSTAAEATSLRLFVADSDITARRGGGRTIFVDPGAWLTPVGGDFELRVSRPDYDTPVTINQVDTATGEIVRSLPADMLDGWFGLGRFGSYQVLEADGDVVVDETFSLCLNSFGRQRSPTTARSRPGTPTSAAAARSREARSGGSTTDGPAPSSAATTRVRLAGTRGRVHDPVPDRAAVGRGVPDRGRGRLRRGPRHSRRPAGASRRGRRRRRPAGPVVPAPVGGGPSSSATAAGRTRRPQTVTWTSAEASSAAIWNASTVAPIRNWIVSLVPSRPRQLNP